MAAYCGCGTKSNRIKWSIFLMFLLMGFCLFILGNINYRDCVDDSLYFEYQDNDIYESCAEDNFIYVVGAIVCWVISSIPLYVMCCCTKKPQHLQPAVGVVAQNRNSNTEYPAIYVATASPVYDYNTQYYYSQGVPVDSQNQQQYMNTTTITINNVVPSQSVMQPQYAPQDATYAAK
eukprot:TRINITY_DN1165_c0_g2_i1.p3 TRINITY_DN1165_c0_g2~~TRINITY_DN1165_c0_g2_i1.p3  ORF type:complete len:177 (-),score=9.93 TRINITY_DN1165_c0_g2_i1:2064-2594(-)